MFRPSYLPDGWSYVLHPGSGGQRSIPLEAQVDALSNPYWITVREGLVTKIEEQYLP